MKLLIFSSSWPFRLFGTNSLGADLVITPYMWYLKHCKLLHCERVRSFLQCKNIVDDIVVLGDILPLQIVFWIQSTIKYWPHYAKALCGVWNTTLVILLPTLYWLFISHRIKLNSNKWPMKTFKDLDHCLPFLSLHCPFSHQNSATLSFFFKQSASFHPLPASFCLPCLTGPQLHSVFLITLPECCHSACSLPQFSYLFSLPSLPFMFPFSLAINTWVFDSFLSFYTSILTWHPRSS